MQRITASIVVYNQKAHELEMAVNSILGSTLHAFLYIIDNSVNDDLRVNFEGRDNIKYIFNNANLGYGKAHNIALREAIHTAQYHLIINPDISFEQGTLEKIIAYADAHTNIGLLMPKVLYPDGQLQYLCKLMPTPFDLIMRRFIPDFLKPVFQQRLLAYELQHKNFGSVMEIPNLSGCFMFLRCEALKTVGLFDEKYFMYLEDTDLSRRINSQYQTIYYPEAAIVHHYEKGSYKNYKLLMYHIRSAFYYFGKWGWAFDSTRDTINSILK